MFLSLRRRPLQLFTIFAIFGIYVLLNVSNWWPLQLQKIRGASTYGDLRSVLSAANCYKEIGPEVYSQTGECSYQYGIALLKVLNWLKLSSINPDHFGFALTFLVVVLLLFITLPALHGNKSSFLAFISVVSPGIWLLFERGNFDLLIILILAISVSLLTLGHSVSASLLISITALFKFYTFPLLILVLLIEEKYWKRVVILGLSLSIMAPMVTDILNAESHPNPLFVAFGLPAMGLWINFFSWRFNLPISLNIPLQYFVGLIVMISLYIFSRIFSLVRYPALVMGKSGSWKLYGFLFSSTVYVSCFFAGMNYDYRLFFLSVSIVLMVAIDKNFVIGRPLLVLQFSALWFTYFFFGAIGAIPVLLALVGNFFQYVLAGYLALIVLRVVHELAPSRLTYSMDLTRKI